MLVAPHAHHFKKYQASQERLCPLPSRSSPAGVHEAPRGVDWSDHYWGYTPECRHERRAVVRCLPRNITDRILLEPIEHVLSFLEWERKELYNCALACHAWHHRSPTSLYSRVTIWGRRDYDAIARAYLQSPPSRPYLVSTRLLCIMGKPDDEQLPLSKRQYYQNTPSIPCRLMSSLRCLTFAACLCPPYHRRFVLDVTVIGAVHMVLSSFTFYVPRPASGYLRAARSVRARARRGSLRSLSGSY